MLILTRKWVVFILFQDFPEAESQLFCTIASNMTPRLPIHAPLLPECIARLLTQAMGSIEMMEPVTPFLFPFWYPNVGMYAQEIISNLVSACFRQETCMTVSML